MRIASAFFTRKTTCLEYFLSKQYMKLHMYIYMIFYRESAFLSTAVFRCFCSALVFGNHFLAQLNRESETLRTGCRAGGATRLNHKNGNGPRPKSKASLATFFLSREETFRNIFDGNLKFFFLHCCASIAFQTLQIVVEDRL